MARKLTKEDIENNPILKELGFKEDDTVTVTITEDDGSGGGVENPNKPPPPKDGQ